MRGLRVSRLYPPASRGAVSKWLGSNKKEEEAPTSQFMGAVLVTGYKKRGEETLFSCSMKGSLGLGSSKDGGEKKSCSVKKKNK